MGEESLCTKTTLLVVDDDECMREALVLMLEEVGYNVKEASRFEEAMEVMQKEEDISLAIVDYTMPGKNGIDTLRELKNVKPSMGALLISGFSLNQNELKGLNNVLVLEKPFQLQELKDKIDNILSKTERKDL